MRVSILFDLAAISWLCVAGVLPPKRQVVTSVIVASSPSPSDAQLVVTLEHAPGVHTWPSAPQTVPELPGFQTTVTRIDVLELEPRLRVGSYAWPASQLLSISIAGKPVVMNAFIGTTRVNVPLSGVTPGGRVRGRIVVRYQPCDDRVCYRPQSDTLSFSAVPR
jgi:hypothetical protein